MLAPPHNANASIAHAVDAIGSLALNTDPLIRRVVAERRPRGKARTISSDPPRPVLPFLPFLPSQRRPRLAGTHKLPRTRNPLQMVARSHVSYVPSPRAGRSSSHAGSPPPPPPPMAVALAANGRRAMYDLWPSTGCEPALLPALARGTPYKHHCGAPTQSPIRIPKTIRRARAGQSGHHVRISAGHSRPRRRGRIGGARGGGQHGLVCALSRACRR